MANGWRGVGVLMGGEGWGDGWRGVGLPMADGWRGVGLQSHNG